MTNTKLLILVYSYERSIVNRLDHWVIYQCAGKRTFATPKPNPNPPKPSFFNKKLVRKSQKLKKQGVLTVNIIPISQKSAKIAIFSCQKNRVPNKIKT